MKKQAVLKTLHYFDIFDFPLMADEIEKFLPEPVSIPLEEPLSLMSADDKRISADNGFYCLPGREGIVEIRRRRGGWSEPKLKKAKRIASILKFIPWIKLIAVTGALAMANSDEDDDIDLMMITSSGRLWLTRGLVVSFLLLTGQYRRPEKVKDMVCPNLMISEEALEFPDHDLFTAHEIVQMRPIFERDGMYQKFLQANRWVFELLPNATKISNANKISQGQALRMQGLALIDFLEEIAYKLQLKYMDKRRTVEITTPSLIRFHPEDIRQKVLDEYQKRIYNLPK
jgi:hypothetical protein